MKTNFSMKPKEQNKVNKLLAHIKKNFFFLKPQQQHLGVGYISKDDGSEKTKEKEACFLLKKVNILNKSTNVYIHAHVWN